MPQLQKQLGSGSTCSPFHNERNHHTSLFFSVPIDLELRAPRMASNCWLEHSSINPIHQNGSSKKSLAPPEVWAHRHWETRIQYMGYGWCEKSYLSLVSGGRIYLKNDTVTLYSSRRCVSECESNSVKVTRSNSTRSSNDRSGGAMGEE